MTEQIDAILFDMGGTLRRGTSREFTEKVERCKKILELTGVDTDPVDFTRMLDGRANAYRKWSRIEQVELNEVGFWSHWMLPELEADKLGALAVELNRLWRDADRSYLVFPDTRETILGLFRGGYRLGLVSNTTSSVEAPNLLNELGLGGYFETIVLSCQVGIRKPRPEIILEATRRMGIPPERCAYIGNLPDRDVASARSAGFSRTVILRDALKPFDLPVDPTLMPDHFIDSLKELLDLFPAHPTSKGERLQAAEYPVYVASLSTMWARKNFETLDDFFLAARRLGFSAVELNHQMNSEKLNQVDLKKYQLSSIHEPCPADIPMDTLKQRDWMISSTNEECRQQGVVAVKRSIDLAGSLGVHKLVVHAGHVSLDMTLEKELIKLYNAGQLESAAYHEMKSRMMEQRCKLIAPRFEAVQKSLRELLEYAARFEVCLGLENRFHYFDIPSQDELATLLELAGSERIGFIYDSGHAAAMGRLGFFPSDLWLERFSPRIIGTHLHDVRGVSDHLAPGLGDVDFRKIAGYLPPDAFRTIEVIGSHTPEQLRNALKLLLDIGCIRLMEAAKS